MATKKLSNWKQERGWTIVKIEWPKPSFFPPIQLITSVLLSRCASLVFKWYKLTA